MKSRDIMQVLSIPFTCHKQVDSLHYLFSCITKLTATTPVSSILRDPTTKETRDLSKKCSYSLEFVE
jgi:hypothetical protein